MAGDVIMTFDNEDVTTMRSLPRLVARAPIDKTVAVDVLRKGERKTLQVTVGRLTDEEEKALDERRWAGGRARRKCSA